MTIIVVVVAVQVVARSAVVSLSHQGLINGADVGITPREVVVSCGLRNTTVDVGQDNCPRQTRNWRSCDTKDVPEERQTETALSE